MPTVLVTGAGGYIAKHIIRELLEGGFQVKPAVRSDRAEAQLKALFPEADFEFARLDLTADAGWAEAMQGVDVLMHTASPFPMGDPADPEELIRPAVDGTLRALGAAQRAGVNRVVLTSSCAAVYKDASKAPLARSTRANWTDPTGPVTSAYEASKTLAEKAAWDFAAAHPEMQLTTICPGVVLGRPLDQHYGTSLQYVEQLLAGMPMVPPMNLPVVDVRDVARMHVGVLRDEATCGQRYPANVGAVEFIDLARWLKAAYPDRKIGVRVAPKWLLRVAAKFNPTLRVALHNLDRNLDVDGSDGPRELGFSYVSAKDSVLDSADFLVSQGK